MFFACHPLFQAPSASVLRPTSIGLSGWSAGRTRDSLPFIISLSLSERPKVVFSRALFRFSAVYNDAPSTTLPEVFLCGLSPPESPLGVIHSGWQPE